VPLLVLYEVSILLGKLARRRSKAVEKVEE